MLKKPQEEVKLVVQNGLFYRDWRDTLFRVGGERWAGVRAHAGYGGDLTSLVVERFGSTGVLFVTISPFRF